ncbi:unnamed protein product [Rotaria socialis]|uniref:Ubiquitin-like domain-containing protein n=1 Tax=Rotaria socialis TaxID=392032 RepID=A0A818EMH8_9BILA|nr:unnamed protein product [Rotaria socialis]CAF3461817.1 unnamed protein product [Rotaria socialis]CAF4236948.1 unnamed protein product [Rotaria socialis]CAF4467926.1 unnamed protein product [Rotaria socialis]
MTFPARFQTDSDLLTAAFSAIMGLDLSTNVSNSDHVEKVSLFDHHKTTYSYGRVGNTHATSTAANQCLLFIKMLGDVTIECEVKTNATIQEIKARIYELEGISPDKQRLIFGGKQLEDGKTMSEYGMSLEPTLHLVARLHDTNPVILDPSTLDPIHNYDFTNINDGQNTFIRGGARYIRPCGFKRFALNVSDKFENLQWLGCNDSEGEWPVSYHGTSAHNNKTIAQDGYALTQERQLAFTRGVYSTPDIQLATKYAKRFTYNNEQYLVVFQNRVNPANVVKFKSVSPGTEDYWVSPSDTDVRPYGICIRKV